MRRPRFTPRLLHALATLAVAAGVCLLSMRAAISAEQSLKSSVPNIVLILADDKCNSSRTGIGKHRENPRLCAFFGDFRIADNSARLRQIQGD